MKKINYLMAMFIAAVLCVGLVSCKKSKNDDSPDFPTAQQFLKTWNGVDSKGNGVSLKVNDATSATFSYIASTAKKNTQEAKTVQITYTYDPSNGKFTGTDDDNYTYEASFKSATELNFSLKPLGEMVILK